MSEIVYALCAATALLCSTLLFRGYRRTASRLLLWSGLCFLGLAINNGLLIVDRLVNASVDLSTVRLFPALIGMALLMYGLIWESD